MGISYVIIHFDENSCKCDVKYGTVAPGALIKLT